MRVLVCGSRHFNDYNRLEKEFWNFEPHKWTLLIHGAARGADTLSGLFAAGLGIPVSSFPADWVQYGRRAGPIRNHQMLTEGCPDLVIGFVGPNSRGTRHMLDISKKAGIPVKEINIEN